VSPLGFLQAVQRFTDLPPHGMRLGEVDAVPGLPFR
jgi:hypothetical protein